LRPVDIRTFVCRHKILPGLGRVVDCWDFFTGHGWRDSQ
jgi:hypothetical protein